MHKPPTCPYCKRHAKLVDGSLLYPDNARVVGKSFWLCQPCEAWVACHENSPTLKPVGRLANAELRLAKRKAHGAFDLLWQVGYQRQVRTMPDKANKSDCIQIAYRWLAERMGIPKTESCHIGAFDVDQCLDVQTICRVHGHELMERF